MRKRPKINLRQTKIIGECMNTSWKQHNELYNEGGEGYNPHDYEDPIYNKVYDPDESRKKWMDKNAKQIEEQQKLINNYKEKLKIEVDIDRIDWFSKSLLIAENVRDFLMETRKRREDDPNFFEKK
jgi:hypothetical protein